MPNGAFLYADQLNQVLTAKSEQGGFKDLVSTNCTPEPENTWQGAL